MPTKSTETVSAGMNQLAILDEERGRSPRPTRWPSLGGGTSAATLARGLALTSRATASVVRRLDDCVADDLGRSLAPTE